MQSRVKGEFDAAAQAFLVEDPADMPFDGAQLKLSSAAISLSAKTALVFPPEKTLFVVSREHQRYCEEVLADVPPENLIVEPQDDGSFFAVFYAALRLKRINPAAILAFFPADLEVADARQFMTEAERAASENESLSERPSRKSPFSPRGNRSSG